MDKPSPFSTFSRPAIRAVVADDHPLVVWGIRKMLESHGIAVPATTGDINDIVPMLERTKPDILILDYYFESLRSSDGLRILQQIRQRKLSLQVILYSGATDPVTVISALRLGVRGFVSKSSSLTCLRDAIFAAAEGHLYVDADTERQLLQYNVGKYARQPDREVVLSRREEQVVSRLAAGLTLVEISQQFQRSIKTVSTQKRSAMRKLGATSDYSLIKAYNNINEMKGHRGEK